MKSVKLKLFISYALTIFLILFFMSIVSMFFFKENAQNNSLKVLDASFLEIKNSILNNSDEYIKNINAEIELKELFLIILKNDKVLFSNQTRNKTALILEEIDYKDDDKKYEDFESERKKEIDEFYDDYEDKGYIELDDYVMHISYVEKKNEFYEIYLGIDENYVEKSQEEIEKIIISINSVLFLLLMILGYYLINKTMRPLKQILNDLEGLQQKEDLTLRLKEQNTGDEFEQLSNTFNKMLEGIEKSVENIKQFSSDASHELKTPLTIIQGEIELCLQGDKSKEELKMVLEKIDKEQKGLQNIIQDFLLLARLDKEIIKQNTASLDKVVFDCIELNLENLENKNLELKVDIEENLEVLFNEKYLHIVINNLISNAVKYTNAGFVKIIAKKQKNSILFEVSDSGIGIKKEDLDKIYERFFRVDKVRSSSAAGVGLGLAIVKKICDRFTYKIDVKSELHKGSKFSIRMYKKVPNE
ncbi:MAG: HAMP domain-containing histidine kinase [Campylobacteraceae bacterium]|nr:HAMP domain-containing histidine kinase [Campylobacteraceae bacterium]